MKCYRKKIKIVLTFPIDFPGLERQNKTVTIKGKNRKYMETKTIPNGLLLGIEFSYKLISVASRNKLKVYFKL